MWSEKLTFDLGELKRFIMHINNLKQNLNGEDQNIKIWLFM